MIRDLYRLLPLTCFFHFSPSALSLQPASFPEKGYDVAGVMSELVNYDLKPDSVSPEVTDTVSVIAEIVGKSIRTLSRTLSLLKTPPEIQVAIRAGNLPVSQGYLFAANLDCPDLMKIFDNIINKPVTNDTLDGMLTEYKKVKRDLSGMKPKPLTKQYASLRSIKTVIQRSAGKYAKEDLNKLLNQLQALCALVEEQMQTATPADQIEPPDAARPGI